MSLSIGIVGMPNVGKSTLFRALTKKEVDISNYPFATIDPNVGVVEVPDDRLKKLAELSHSARIVPAAVEFVDIAGLVRGANKGEGLGNQFLARIREVDLIVYIVRAFSDTGVHHVEGRVDPKSDVEIIATELALKDLETVEKRLSSLEKEERAGVKGAAVEKTALLVLREGLSAGRKTQDIYSSVSEESLRENIIAAAKNLQLLYTKPGIFLVNSDTGSILAEELKSFLAEFHYPIVQMNVREEYEAAGFSATERAELGLAEAKLPTLVQNAYTALGLITFFTTGEDETRAWTITKGVSAKNAAGVIHTDFTENFIAMQVIAWDKLLAAGGWAEARTQGLVRSEGKEYEVKDGDVAVVMHNA